MEIAALVISIVSLCLMGGLHYRTTKLQERIANRDRDTLEFVANLVTNAAYDPDIVRRLIFDYQKEMRWRGVVSYNGDKHHSIAYKMPKVDEITIGDLKIAVRQPREDDSTSS